MRGAQTLAFPGSGSVSLTIFLVRDVMCVVHGGFSLSPSLLQEAKELVESAPKPLKESLPTAEADELKKKLEAIGAKIELV